MLQNQILSDTLVFIFDSIFFSICNLRYFQEFGKRHPHALIHSGRCVIFEKKIQNFDYPVHWALKITNTRAIFMLSYVRPRLVLALCGLRAHGKSVESRTRTVSSRVTLAERTRRECTAGIRCLLVMYNGHVQKIRAKARKNELVKCNNFPKSWTLTSTTLWS